MYACVEIVVASVDPHDEFFVKSNKTSEFFLLYMRMKNGTD